MAITQVRAQFNGQWYTLTYNESARAYQATITPESYSGDQPGGYYNVTVEATNDIGTVVTADGTSMPGLQLVVKEIIPPTITLVSPTPGYVTTATPTVTWSAVDNEGGSGIDPDSASVTVDGTAASASEITVTAGTGGAYTISFTPSSALAEGTRSIQLSISDNDGNEATNTAVYIVDTVPPALSVSTSLDVVVTDSYTVDLSGVTNDATAPPVVVSVDNNGETAGPVTVNEDGTFALTVSLDVGENYGTVTAIDGAGLETTTSYYFIRLITDRTQADVDRARELAAKGWAGMTTEEQAEYSTDLKGAYNASDLNRVNTAMEYLDEWITEAGNDTGYTDQGITWAEASVPTQNQMDGYLSNVETISSVFPINGPDIPESMEALTFEGANSIERVLVLAYGIHPLLIKTPFYSGEIFCGEA